MNRKKARFDVVSIEITAHCPHCDSLAKPPLAGKDFIWTTAAIAEQGSNDIKCRSCSRWFRLPDALRQLLRPSSEPVSPDRRVGIARIEIVCGTCAGDELQPTLTLLTTDGRCSVCGGRNYGMVKKIQHSNGKEKL
jgi:Zn finger protein HypA/HybF involved in hydrogenase expression